MKKIDLSLVADNNGVVVGSTLLFTRHFQIIQKEQNFTDKKSALSAKSAVSLFFS
jgi:hypothetical protein